MEKKEKKMMMYTLMYNLHEIVRRMFCTECRFLTQTNQRVIATPIEEVKVWLVTAQSSAAVLEDDLSFIIECIDNERLNTAIECINGLDAKISNLITHVQNLTKPNGERA